MAGLREATLHFIQEEQRHSAVLARFLLREGFPPLQHSYVDAIFRRLRKLAGLELMVTVLSTAECIAVPYYSALRDFSPRLSCCEKSAKTFCATKHCTCVTRGHVLSLFSRRGFWRESAVRTLHRWLVFGTGSVVYLQHRRFFRAAQMSWQQFIGAAFQALTQIEQRTGAGAFVGFGWLAQGRGLKQFTPPVSAPRLTPAPA